MTLVVCSIFGFLSMGFGRNRCVESECCRFGASYDKPVWLGTMPFLFFKYFYCVASLGKVAPHNLRVFLQPFLFI